jgi:D-sedoheptulose 7-phosphate isomerase
VSKDVDLAPNLKVGERFYQGNGVLLERATRRAGFFAQIPEAVRQTQVTGSTPDEHLDLEDGLARFEGIVSDAHAAGGRVIFVGNGGSAAVASHMAIDYSKNKGIRATTLCDVATLTALANDFGYDRVFSRQIAWHGRREDVMVIISSSGRSLNIIDAADEARSRGLWAIVTLTGMNPNNRLRMLGSLNFWVPSDQYAVVENTHLQLLHSLVLC